MQAIRNIISKILGINTRKALVKLNLNLKALEIVMKRFISILILSLIIWGIVKHRDEISDSVMDIVNGKLLDRIEKIINLPNATEKTATL